MKLTFFNSRSDNRTLKKSLPHKKRISRKLKKNVSINKKLCKCNLCEQSFSTPEEFTEHQSLCETTITPVSSSSFACQLCTASFSDQLTFFGHLKVHYEPINESNCEETSVNTVLYTKLFHLTLVFCTSLQKDKKNRIKLKIKEIHY